MPKRQTVELGAPATLKLRTLEQPEPERGSNRSTAFYLVLINPPGPNQYRDYPLYDSPFLIGRDRECHVSLDRTEVSRQHARLERRGDVWMLQDLGSTNGTHIDGSRITQQPIGPGMNFHVVHCEFVLLTSDDPALFRFRRYFLGQRHDELTELPNADVLQEVLGALTPEAHIGVTIVEVDNFQRLNASLGRDVCDALLREVAQKLALRVRDAEMYRLPGARFAMLHRGASPSDEETQLLTESVRRAIAVGGFQRPVTLSAGIAEGAGVPSAALLAQAERALTRARRLGGGQVRREIEASPDVIEIGDRTSVELKVPQRPYERLLLSELQNALTPGGGIFAVDIANHQLIANTDQRLFERLDRILDQTLQIAISESSSREIVVVGEGVNGRPLFVAFSNEDRALAARVGAAINRTFAERCRSEGVDGNLRIGRQVTVSSPTEAIGMAIHALERGDSTSERMLPLPIGYSLRRLAESSSPEQRFFGLIRVHHSLTRWLFSVFAAELLHLSSGEAVALPHTLDTMLRRRVSDGSWVMLVREYVNALSRLGRGKLFIPAYLEMVLADDAEVLRTLSDFAAARNQFAHGHDAEALALYDRWSARTQSLLAGPLASLGDYPVRYTEGSDHVDDEVFDVHFKTLMGDNMIPVRVTERRTHTVPAGRVVVAAPDGRYLSLSPFAVYLRCPQCQAQEVFFLDQLQPNVSFRSLRQNAHVVHQMADGVLDHRFIEPLRVAIDRALFAL